MGRIAGGWWSNHARGWRSRPASHAWDCLWGPPFGGFKKVAVVSLFCFIPNLIASGKECEFWHGTW